MTRTVCVQRCKVLVYFQVLWTYECSHARWWTPVWIAENKPTVSGNQLPMDTEASKGTLFEATPPGNSVVSLTEMDPDSVDCDFAILDARSSERFFGKVPEPRPGLRSGHIPGSSNLPFTNLLCEDENAMLFKENEELLESFRR